ncbi:MAG: GIY-YIG nuclease family protein [Iphinoe sp. HA4291-MV1]|jgi:hypothetical protein|nr:GIY-YIG nuclease family protein [Iphinoe sp. HA4291-MV1]
MNQAQKMQQRNDCNARRSIIRPWKSVELHKQIRELQTKNEALGNNARHDLSLEIENESLRARVEKLEAMEERLAAQIEDVTDLLIRIYNSKEQEVPVEVENETKSSVDWEEYPEIHASDIQRELKKRGLWIDLDLIKRTVSDIGGDDTHGISQVEASYVFKECFNQASSQEDAKLRELINRFTWLGFKPGKRKSCVYFIYCEKANAIKIGYSLDVAARLSSLQTGNPCKLKVLTIVLGGVREEKVLHNFFDTSRLLGEWFTLSECLVHYLLFINEQGVYKDPSTMPAIAKKKKDSYYSRANANVAERKLQAVLADEFLQKCLPPAKSQTAPAKSKPALPKAQARFFLKGGE